MMNLGTVPMNERIKSAEERCVGVLVCWNDPLRFVLVLLYLYLCAGLMEKTITLGNLPSQSYWPSSSAHILR